LDSIRYGSNGNASSPLSIIFNYGYKSYIQKQWISGYYFEDYYLLIGISVESAGEKLRQYRLDYYCYDLKNEKYILSKKTETI